LVAPEMKTSLFTETWMNGPNDFDSECSSKYTVNNIESLNVDGNQFKNSKDHSKWAISVDEKEPLLCIGDINRQKSQMKRGGGTVCILNDRLWGLYNKTIVNVQPCQIN
uniref:Cell-death-related nuclease 7 (inferred by orthology to a C. elegans protein) n=1 Tax=Anisakis simplex TaxID=6269 RepID=A0A0M3KCV0_ANISI